MNDVVLAFGFSPGPMEIIIIGIVFVLLFGKRVPEIARSMGSSIVEFKKGIKGVEEDVGSLNRDLNNTTREINESVRS